MLIIHIHSNDPNTQENNAKEKVLRIKAFESLTL